MAAGEWRLPSLLSASGSPRATTGLGHEDAFPRPRLSVRCRFSQGTFARTGATGETPEADLALPAARSWDGAYLAQMIVGHSPGAASGSIADSQGRSRPPARGPAVF